MPTFPQHRNIKSSKTAAPDANTGAGDQTNNLPAISDLVCLFYLKICSKLLIRFFFTVGFYCEEKTCWMKKKEDVDYAVCLKLCLSL